MVLQLYWRPGIISQKYLILLLLLFFELFVVPRADHEVIFLADGPIQICHRDHFLLLLLDKARRGVLAALWPWPWRHRHLVVLEHAVWRGLRRRCVVQPGHGQLLVDLLPQGQLGVLAKIVLVVRWWWRQVRRLPQLMTSADTQAHSGVALAPACVVEHVPSTSSPHPEVVLLLQVFLQLEVLVTQTPRGHHSLLMVVVT